MKNFVLAVTLIAATSGAMARGGPAAPEPKFNFDAVSLADVTLNQTGATQFAHTDANVANGNTNLLPSSLGTGWGFVGSNSAFPSASGSLTINGADISWSYLVTSKGDGDNDRAAGTWQLTSSKAVTLELAFGAHAGQATGVWMFDDVSLAESVTNEGTFALGWTNKNGGTPGFSNFSLFARDVTVTSPVPEPETYAMLLAALGIIGLTKRRKQAA